jgi:hypothetical protein
MILKRVPGDWAESRAGDQPDFLRSPELYLESYSGFDYISAEFSTTAIISAN